MMPGGTEMVRTIAMGPIFLRRIAYHSGGFEALVGSLFYG